MSTSKPHSERERQFEYAMEAVQRQLPSYTNWIRNHVRDLEEQLETARELNRDARLATPVRDDTRDAHFALEKQRMVLNGASFPATRPGP